MKTILLTGATGFIGSYLLESLLKNTSFKIIILKRTSSDAFRIQKHLDKVHCYDVNFVSLESIFNENRIDGIVHLATYYVKSHESKDISDMIDSNVKFPTQLLEIANQKSVDFFINTGTFFEYSIKSNPISEKSKTEPFNLYASTKASFDAVLKYYANNSSINILTLKLAAPFGYNDNYKLIPFLIDSILNNKAISLEKGEQEWDFIYVRDVVTAFENAIKLCLNSKRTLFEEILVGTGKKTSIKSIVNILKDISQTDLITLEKEYTTQQIFVSYVDNTKAKNLLQWVPKYSMEDALKETYELYKENN